MAISFLVAAAVVHQPPTAGGLPSRPAQTPASSITNPLTTDEVGNPFVLATGSQFVAFGQQAGLVNIPVRTSTNLATWGSPTEALPTRPAWAGGGAVYSPSVATRSDSGGTLYVLYFAVPAASDGKTCLGTATSRSVTGPYTPDAAPLLCHPEYGGAMAPGVVNAQPSNPNGGLYLFWKTGGNPSNGGPERIWSTLLAADGRSLAPGMPRTTVMTAQAGWENNRISEPAPYFDAASGKLSLLYTGQWSVANSVAMNWATCEQDPNNIFAVGSCTRGQSSPWVKGTSSVTGPGGGSLFTDADGRAWLAYHGWTTSQCGGGNCFGVTPRSLRVDKFCTLNRFARSPAPTVEAQSTTRNGNCATDVPAPTCGVAASAITATPNATWDNRFQAYGNDNSSTADWTGGDGGIPFPIPDGRRLWGFGDHFVGAVNANGTRPTGTLRGGGTLVVESAAGALVQTLRGGSGNPGQFPAPAGRVAWPGDSVVEGNQLVVLVSQFTGGEHSLSYEYHGYGFDTIELPGLTRTLGTSPAPISNPGDMNVHYKQVLQDRGWNYIYGIKRLGTLPFDPSGIFVARAPVGHLRDPWQYMNAAGQWVSDPTAAAPQLTSLWQHGTGVAKVGDAYMLPDLSTLSSDIKVRFACTPTGPWSDPVSIYTPPAIGTGCDKELGYGAYVLEPFITGNKVLMVYSQNARDDDRVDPPCVDVVNNYTHASIYRPHFVDVTFTGLPGT